MIRQNNVETVTVFDADASLFPLWKEAFGDNDDFIYRAIDIINGEARAFAIEKDSVIISQLIAFELNLHKLKGLYIYAVATKKEYRNRGYMKLLFSELSDYAKENSYDFLILIPKDRRMAEIYRSMRFETEIPLFASPYPRNAEDIAARGTLELFSFDGNFDRLYERYSGGLGPGSFRYAIETYENAEIAFTKSGFALVNSENRHMILACSQSELSKICVKPEYYALVKKITDFADPEIYFPEPLPR